MLGFYFKTMNWINVNNRLPTKEESEKNILVWCKQINYNNKVDEWPVLLNFNNNKFIFTFNGGEFEDDYTNVVTHWCIPTKPE